MKSRTVIVSGASSGIGLATAQRFAAAGDRVVTFSRSRPATDDAVGEWIQLDACDWDGVHRAVDSIREQYGSIDVVIANAGLSMRRTFEETTRDDFRALLETNVMGVIALWQAAVRHMAQARSGVLLATASTNANVGYPHYAGYNASKAAVLALTRTLALEYAPYIRTACVSPGYVMTPMQRAEYTDEMFAEVNAKIPAGRHGDPAEIAETFFFLASDAARFITGQQFVVDGGELAGGIASSHGTAFSRDASM